MSSQMIFIHTLYPLHTNSWDGIARTLFANSPVSHLPIITYTIMHIRGNSYRTAPHHTAPMGTFFWEHSVCWKHKLGLDPHCHFIAEEGMKAWSKAGWFIFCYFVCFPAFSSLFPPTAGFMKTVPSVYTLEMDTI